MAAPIDLSNAGSLEQQVYEVALALTEVEKAVPEENRPDQAQIEFDNEANTAAITITLNTLLNIVDGKAVISAQTYLN